MDFWDGLYGQHNVKKILTRLIYSGNIPHALLFSGNSGTGKFLSAIRFTGAVNHEYKNPVLERSINDLAEPYVKFIFPLPRGKNEDESSSAYEKLNPEEMQIIQEQLDNKKNNPYYQIKIPKANIIKVNSIRDINKFLTYNYEDVKYRTIIIADAHLMNEESQNALLKNLEEPPPGIIFILTTPYPMNLRETIRSRCWQINFQPLDNEDVKNILVKHFLTDPERAETASRFSGGSVTFALQLLENDIETLLEKTISVLRYSFGRKINSAYTAIKDITEENESELFKLVVQLMITWFNDVLKHRTGSKDIAFRKYIETVEKFNSKFPDADIPSVTIKLEYYVSLLKNNVNTGILLLNTINTLAQLTAK